MKRNNIINRIFFPRTVRNNKKMKEYIDECIALYPIIDNKLSSAKSLDELLSVHKEAFRSGFNSPHLDVCEWGMFRGFSVESLNRHQVFLGNIYGLHTLAIPVWEQYRDEPFGVNGFGIPQDYPLYKIVFGQYAQYLKRNINAMYNKYLKDIKEYAICGY
jgi:hypothetical protein